jgi:hypothetical protein
MHAKVWNCWEVREKKDVIREARRAGKVVQFGRVHGICVEKNSELPMEHPNRKYKGRVVFLGNRVSNQDLEAATFADMGNAPANLESGRLADCYGSCPGHASENADGVQAYLQARKRGDACWVELPPEAHPGNIWGPELNNLPAAQFNKLVAMWKQLKCPVVLMLSALYGHPDSVSDWQDHCTEKVGLVGFDGFGSEWPSVFYHKGLRLLLTIYVDDFKLAGPEENIAMGWELLRQHIDIGPSSRSGMYLGCNIVKQKINNGNIDTNAIVYDMESFLEQCVAKYLHVAGSGTTLKQAKTPFLPPLGTNHTRYKQGVTDREPHVNGVDLRSATRPRYNKPRG